MLSASDLEGQALQLTLPCFRRQESENFGRPHPWRFSILGHHQFTCLKAAVEERERDNQLKRIYGEAN